MLHDEVLVTTRHKEKIIPAHELRQFFENKLETDYFFKQKSIERASIHPNVKLIERILDRDEANKD